MKKLLFPIVLILVILTVDQALKIWVKTNMRYGDEVALFGNWQEQLDNKYNPTSKEAPPQFIKWAKLRFIENNGMAFGLELGGEFGKITLSVFRILAVLAIGWFIISLVKKKVKSGLIVGLAFIFAGALGNILDSAFYGLMFSDSYSEISTIFPDDGGYASFLHGRVVDMFYFPLYETILPDWVPFKGGDYFIFFRPVFNVADSSITTGVLLIILFYRKEFNRVFTSKKNEEAPEIS